MPPFASSRCSHRGLGHCPTAKQSWPVFDTLFNEPLPSPKQAKVLKSLLEYVLYHFLAEEVLMKRMNYPNFKQHRAIHQAFTTQCLEVQSKFNDSTLDIDGALLGSLYQWSAQGQGTGREWGV